MRPGHPPCSSNGSNANDSNVKATYDVIVGASASASASARANVSANAGASNANASATCCQIKRRKKGGEGGP